jgi:hypothetical protein
MSGSKTAVGRELAKYRFDLLECRRPYGTKGILNQQKMLEFSVEYGTKIVNWGL